MSPNLARSSSKLFGNAVKSVRRLHSVFSIARLFPLPKIARAARSAQRSRRYGTPFCRICDVRVRLHERAKSACEWKSRLVEQREENEVALENATREKDRARTQGRLLPGNEKRRAREKALLENWLAAPSKLQSKLQRETQSTPADASRCIKHSRSNVPSRLRLNVYNNAYIYIYVYEKR